MFTLIFTYLCLFTVIFGSEACGNSLDQDCEEISTAGIDNTSDILLQDGLGTLLKKITKKIEQKELQLDLFLFVVLILFVMFYAIGSVRNRRIYLAWKEQTVKHYIGSAQTNTVVYKMRNDQYILCNKPNNPEDNETKHESLAIELSLVKRHNLLKLLIDSYSLNSISDVVSINYKLKTKFRGVFGIVVKRLANDYRRKRQDLNQLTKQTKSKELEENYVLLYETPEMFKIIENQNLRESLKKCQDFVLAMTYTDQPSSYPQKLPVEETKILTIDYKFNSEMNNKVIGDIKQLCDIFVEILSTFEISAEGRKKITKNRTLVYQPVERRMEEEKKKLLEEKRQNANSDRDKKAERAKMKKKEEKAKKKMGKKGVTKMMMRN